MRYPLPSSLLAASLHGVGDNGLPSGGIADRATYSLAKPVELPSGARVLEMVVATPGVMEYPYGRVYVPPETLADPEYNSAFAGIPFIVDDPRVHSSGSGGVNISDPAYDSLRLGVFLGSRWDDEQQAQIARVVVDKPAAFDAMRGGMVGVSPYYYPDFSQVPGTTPTGQDYDLSQSKRKRPDHVVLTRSPRGAAAHVGYADSTTTDVDVAALCEALGLGDNTGPEPIKQGGSSMDLKQLLAALSRVGVEVPASVADSDDPNALASRIVDGACADLKAEVIDLTAKGVALKGEADSLRVDQTAAHRVAWRDVETAAKVAKIDIADDVTLVAAQEMVITKLSGSADSIPAGTHGVVLSGLVNALSSETFAGFRPKVEIEEVKGEGDTATTGGDTIESYTFKEA